MRYEGKPLFEEEFPPVFDSATGKYEEVKPNRFVYITSRYEASHNWLEANTRTDTTLNTSGRCCGFGVSLELDGVHGAGMGMAAWFLDKQNDLKGSAVDVGVRMAGTTRVEAAEPIVRGDFLTTNEKGQAVKWTAASPYPVLAQAKEDAAIGSLIFVRFNGM